VKLGELVHPRLFHLWWLLGTIEKWHRFATQSIHFNQGKSSTGLIVSLFTDHKSRCFLYTGCRCITLCRLSKASMTKSAFSFWHQPTTWQCLHFLPHVLLWRHCCWAPAVQQSIDFSRLLAQPRAANTPHAAAVADSRDSQTDRHRTFT